LTGTGYLKGAVGTSLVKAHVFRKRVRKVQYISEGWIHGRDSSAGIATSYRLDGPGSISLYFQFLILSVFLCITYLLTYLCINVLVFCILYYLCVTVYVGYFVYRLYTTRIKCINTLLSLHVSALLGHHQVTEVYNYDIKVIPIITHYFILHYLMVLYSGDNPQIVINSLCCKKELFG
jgi:hypothetical protein